MTKSVDEIHFTISMSVPIQLIFRIDFDLIELILILIFSLMQFSTFEYFIYIEELVKRR